MAKNILSVKMKLIIVIILSVFSSINGADNDTASQKWINMFNEIGRRLTKLSKIVTPEFERIVTEEKISPECESKLREFVTGHNNQEWIFKMLDSWGRLPIGLMSGTVTNLGDYDQCVDIDASNDTNTMVGKYCFLTFRPPMPEKGKVISLNGSEYENSWLQNLTKKAKFYRRISNGICIPSVCEEKDMTLIFKNALKSLNMTVEVNHCSTKVDNKIKMNLSRIIALSILGTLALLTIIGTIADETKSKSQLTTLLRCFSFSRNIGELYNIPDDDEMEKNKQFLAFINGIRVLSIIWIIIAHTYPSAGARNAPSVVARYMTDAPRMVKALLFQIILNATLSVHTFMFTSGFIGTYVILKKLKANSNTQLNFFSFVAHRYLRLLPSMIGGLCLVFIIPLLGSGPLLHNDFVHDYQEICANNWWQNVLLINNWQRQDYMCMIHSWYLSADFQMHIISYFVLYLYWRNSTKALKTNVLLIISGIIIPFIVFNVVKPAAPQIINVDTSDQSGVSLVFYATYNHFFTYFCGMLLAVTLVRDLRFNFKIPKSLINVGNIFLPLSSIMILFATYPMMQSESIPEDAHLMGSIFIIISRFIWISGLYWLFLWCYNRPTDLISEFLSAKIWYPFSRLTFSMYMFHPFVIMFHGQQLRELVTASHYNRLFESGGVVVFSIFLGSLFYVLFEAPFINISKLLMKNSSKNQTGNGSVPEMETLNVNRDVNENRVENLNENGCEHREESIELTTK